MRELDIPLGRIHPAFLPSLFPYTFLVLTSLPEITWPCKVRKLEPFARAYMSEALRYQARERERDGRRASLKLGILIRRRSRCAETPLTSTYFSLFVYTRDPCVNWLSCRRKKMSSGRNITRGEVDRLIIEARERTLANENAYTPWEVTHENPSRRRDIRDIL